MTPLEIPYKRKAVDPLECIRAGWELVKPQYWLFVDRKLKGLDAVKLSFKAAMANFWRLLAMGRSRA